MEIHLISVGCRVILAELNCNLVGIDIDHASDTVQLERLVLHGMTGEIERPVA